MGVKRGPSLLQMRPAGKIQTRERNNMHLRSIEVVFVDDLDCEYKVGETSIAR